MNGVSYRAEIYELDNGEDIGNSGKIGSSGLIGVDDEPLDTQLISTVEYCYFVNLKPGKEYKVMIVSIKNNEEIGAAQSDIIRTDADSKGGLF